MIFRGFSGNPRKSPRGRGGDGDSHMVRSFWGKIPENPHGDGAGKGDNLELGDFWGKIPEKTCISARDEGRIIRDFLLSSPYVF